MVPSPEMRLMRAYHGKASIKAKYLKRVQAHEKADEIAHGFYWENGKGCAVGCTIEGSDHTRYETELGIPEAIARLEDMLFEGMKNGKAKAFPAKFLSAIKPGADLSLVPAKFIVFVLNDVVKVKEVSEDEKVVAAVKQTADLWQRVIDGKVVSKEEWSAAWSAARSAAWSAAWSAAESAAWSAARSAAWSAARSAAWSAAESAAESATESAAESAAWSAACEKYADHLLVLLKAAPVRK